jgi:hypothetical protein
LSGLGKHHPQEISPTDGRELDSLSGTSERSSTGQGILQKRGRKTVITLE